VFILDLFVLLQNKYLFVCFRALAIPDPDCFPSMTKLSSLQCCPYVIFLQ